YYAICFCHLARHFGLLGLPGLKGIDDPIVIRSISSGFVQCVLKALLELPNMGRGQRKFSIGHRNTVGRPISGSVVIKVKTTYRLLMICWVNHSHNSSWESRS